MLLVVHTLEERDRTANMVCVGRCWLRALEKMKRECWVMGKATVSNTMGREASQEKLVSEHRFDR